MRSSAARSTQPPRPSDRKASVTAFAPLRGSTGRPTRQTGQMISWIARVALLRILPRRLLPVLTAFELFRLARAVRSRRSIPDEKSVRLRSDRTS